MGFIFPGKKCKTNKKNVLYKALTRELKALISCLHILILF